MSKYSYSHVGDGTTLAKEYRQLLKAFAALKRCSMKSVLQSYYKRQAFLTWLLAQEHARRKLNANSCRISDLMTRIRQARTGE